MADPPTTVDAAQAQLDKLEADGSAIDQQYAAVADRLASSDKAARKAAKAAEGQQKRVDAMRSKVAALALQRYQSSGMETASSLFTSADVESFLSNLSLGQQIDGTVTRVVGDYAAQAETLERLRRSADAKVADVSADKARLAALAAQSHAKIAAAQKVLADLTEQQRTALLAQERAQAKAAAAAAHRSDKRVSRSSGKARAAAVGAARSRPQAKSASATKVQKTASGAAAGALAFAESQVGDAYVMGATGPNAYDCSGLMLTAYKSVGIQLPRTSQAQFSAGHAVSLNALQPGDLVFFYSGISHVGMYVGNGTIVHAANPRSGVTYAKLSSMPAAGARRVVG